MESVVRGKLLREAAAILGCVVALYLLLSLATYAPDDASWLVAKSDPDPPRNFGGRFGGNVAALLLFFFGRSAFLFALLVGIVGIVAARAGAGEAPSRWRRWSLAGGFAVWVICSAALENLHFPSAPAAGHSAGGVLGEWTGARFSERFFGRAGGSLLLAALWLCAASWVAGFSWFSVFEKIGRATESLVTRLWRLAVAARDRRAGAREKALRERAVEKIADKQSAKERAKRARKVENIEPVFAPPPPPPRQAAERAQPQLAGVEGARLPPPLSLLAAPAAENDAGPDEKTRRYYGRKIEAALEEFGVAVEVDFENIKPGPVITRYDILPATGVKGAQVTNLARDLARALSVSSVRVLENIPGTNMMGIEIPNPRRQIVQLADLLCSAEYAASKTPTPLALGKDAAGRVVVADLAAMPHLLVAGATGAGKSVCINAIILSMLYKSPPSRLRLILIDPKMLELSMYQDIPHLLAPVVTDMQAAPAALLWCVGEMERRYREMARCGARGINPYNQKAEAGEIPPLPESPEEKPQPMPHLVVIIDELADLMMVTGKKVEQAVCRLAQKARAAGIHLIVATQRPSVDVITGLIKANIPSRIAFQVSSRVDSRTIIDQSGAESLLGSGDMLFLPIGAPTPRRAHGAFVSDAEVQNVTNYLKRAARPEYVTDFSQAQDLSAILGGGEGANGGGESDPLYDQAVQTVVETRRPSISLVQRKLRIGYNRAARLIEDMENAGLVTPMDETGNRKVIAPDAKL